VRKWCAPPFVHAPPPRLHTLPLCLHLGAHRIPPPHFRTPAPLARSTLRPGCASPCSHTLRASTVCFPGCTAHRSVPPSPRARSPCVRSSTDAWPLARGPPLPRALLARGTLCAVLPLCAPPSLLRFRHARKRACGRGGALKRRGKRCGPGGGDRREREGGRRVVTRDGGGIARAEGRTEGWVRIVPPVPSPASEQRVGEGAHAGSA